MKNAYDVVILGAGITGLSAAWALGDRAVVLEADDRPGGLVRTECYEGYWFDRTVHLLYFEDPDTEARIRAAMGPELVPCNPEAWVECEAGTVRYPLQMNLGGLDRSVVARCIHDLAAVTFAPDKVPPTNFEEALLRTFGRAMCETFLFPYNRKQWKRDLKKLAPAGFLWTITRPAFTDVLEGALSQDRRYRAYNATGWYPQPQAGSRVRGIECLSRALAAKVGDLRMQHMVESIDVENRTILVRNRGEQLRFSYRTACCSTLPLPRAIAMCQQAPDELKAACARLKYNRVLSVALSIHGPRPTGRGHWRYYSEESLVFTRLVYMHEFDPESAPRSGWGLLAEVTQPAESTPVDPQELFARVQEDVRRAGALPGDCEVIAAHLMCVDPAYVVFADENEATLHAARSFLSEHDITPLGRYGRWEYSSMAQVMRDGFRWASSLSARLDDGRVPPPELVNG